MAGENSQPFAAAFASSTDPSADAAATLSSMLGFPVPPEDVLVCLTTLPGAQGALEFVVAQVGTVAARSNQSGATGSAAASQVGPAAAPSSALQGASGSAVVPRRDALIETPMSPELPPGFYLPHQQFAPAGAAPQQRFAPVMMPGSQQAPPAMPDQAASMGYTAPIPPQAPAMATMQPYQAVAPSPPLHMMEMQQAQGGHMIAPPPQLLGPPPMMQQQPPQASTFMVEQPPQPFGYPPMMQLQHPPQASPVVMDQPPQPFGYPPFIQQQPPEAYPMMMPHPHLSAPPCKRQRIDQYDMTYGQHMAGYQQDVATFNAANSGPFLQNGPPCPPPNVSSTLYIEGLPNDCTTREVAHIFRQYMGFREVRVVKRPAGKQPMCFVDFATPDQAFLAMESLQGYQFDQQEERSPKLHLEFSRSPRGASSSGGC